MKILVALFRYNGKICSSGKKLVKKVFKNVYDVVIFYELSEILVASYDYDYTIIIKEDVTTNLSKLQIINTISELINMNYDVIVISSWNDNCDTYKNITNEIDKYQLKEITQINSLQVIIIKNVVVQLTGIKNQISDFLNSINSYLVQSKLFAITTIPNLFTFDVMCASSNNELIKLNKCSFESVTTEYKSSSNFIWFIIISIFLIIFFIASIQLLSKYKKNDNLSEHEQI